MNPLAPTSSAAKNVGERERGRGERPGVGGHRAVPLGGRQQRAAGPSGDRADEHAAADRDERLLPQRRRPAIPSTLTAAATAKVTTGTQTPSLSPASTSSARRTGPGTRGIGDDGRGERGVGRGEQRGDEHAEPDVEVAEQAGRRERSRATIVSGSPTTSSRSGSRRSAAARRSPIEEASANRTSASASSARTRTTSPLRAARGPGA